MPQRNYFKLSRRLFGNFRRQILPTGNNFGASNLDILPLRRSSQAIATPTISNYLIFAPRLSLLAIQILSIILLVIWFWCLLAIDCYYRIFAPVE
jgi:hypothetical protein